MIQILKTMSLLKTIGSKISADKDGVFFARLMTDVSVMGRAAIAPFCYRGVTALVKNVPIA